MTASTYITIDEIEDYEAIVNSLLSVALSDGYRPGIATDAQITVMSSAAGLPSRTWTINATVSTTEPLNYKQGTTWLCMTPESPHYRILRLAQYGFPVPAAWYDMLNARQAVDYSVTLGNLTAAVPASTAQFISLPVTTNGQTAFTLPVAPLGPTKFWMEVNGQALHSPQAFTWAGVTVTWLDTAFKLQTTDSVYFYYL
jgi:hypothetical protein